MRSIGDMVNESFDAQHVSDWKCTRCITVIINWSIINKNTPSCNGLGSSRQSVPSSKPHNLFIHLTKIDSG